MQAFIYYTHLLYVFVHLRFIWDIHRIWESDEWVAYIQDNLKSPTQGDVSNVATPTQNRSTSTPLQLRFLRRVASVECVCVCVCVCVVWCAHRSLREFLLWNNIVFPLFCYGNRDDERTYCCRDARTRKTPIWCPLFAGRATRTPRIFTRLRVGLLLQFLL